VCLCVCVCVCVCKATKFLRHACSTFYLLPEILAKFGLHVDKLKFPKLNKTKGIISVRIMICINLLCNFLCIMYNKNIFLRIKAIIKKVLKLGSGVDILNTFLQSKSVM
jgi:hypothetical protein